MSFDLGTSRWYDVTPVATRDFVYGSEEYRVLADGVEVCRVKPTGNEDLTIFDFLISHPVSGPVMACIK